MANAQLLVLLTSAIAGCGARSELLVDTGRDAAGAGDAGRVPRVEDATADADAREEEAGGGVRDALADAPRRETGVSARRPFLVGSSLRSALPVVRDVWLADDDAPHPALPSRITARLARAWLQDALDEHASVAAFARFSLQLLSVGAPPELIADAHRAALDEVRHARLCFSLARRYGGTAQGPGPLPLDDVRLDTTLPDLVALAVEEGCVGETLGAALAAEQLRVATDPHVVDSLRRISRDEQRHAALGWRFLRWAVLRGGDDVRAVAMRTLDRATSAALALKLERYDDPIADWHAHGRLTCLEARSLIEGAVRDVVRPCAEAALRGSRAEALAIS